MNDIKMFIQYHAPLDIDYKDLYNIIDDLDYYHFIRLNAEDVVPDNFIKSIEYSDDTGDNISDKNYHYVDLTALYWYWKNVTCDIIGNDHYSKYFLDKSGEHLISKEDIEDYLEYYDFLIHIATLPGRTVYQIFNDFHGHEYLDVAGNVIQELTPEYYNDFLEVVNGEDAALFNMMICRKSDFDAYCSWLFPIIFECEKRIDLPQDSFQRKMLGCIAERLLLVWLKHNNKTYYGQIPMAENIQDAKEILCKKEENIE